MSGLGGATSRPEDAEAAYREAIRLRPSLLPVYADLANLLRLMNRLESAASTLAAVERFGPPPPEIYSARHLLDQHRREWTERSTHWRPAWPPIGGYEITTRRRWRD